METSPQTSYYVPCEVHCSGFSSALNQQVVNVVVWSPCGKFLAAGTVGGSLSVWDVDAKLCIERYSEFYTASSSHLKCSFTVRKQFDSESNQLNQM